MSIEKDTKPKYEYLKGNNGLSEFFWNGLGVGKEKNSFHCIVSLDTKNRIETRCKLNVEDLRRGLTLAS